MRTKILRYAAGRDDRIVSVYEDVTFENDYVGWYVDSPDEGGHRGWDNIAVVERVGAVCFVACFVSRNALTADVFLAVTDEAQHLQAAMQRRMASGQWIPLPYVAAYEALGWDSRPLRCHRDNIRRKREMREQGRRRQEEKAAEERRQEEERRMALVLQVCERSFVNGGEVDAEMFILLCRRENIHLHPRTLHQLQKRVLRVSQTQIAFKDKGKRLPQGSGCFAAIEQLSNTLKRTMAEKTDADS